MYKYMNTDYRYRHLWNMEYYYDCIEKKGRGMTKLYYVCCVFCCTVNCDVYDVVDSEKIPKGKMVIYKYFSIE